MCPLRTPRNLKASDDLRPGAAVRIGRQGGEFRHLIADVQQYLSLVVKSSALWCAAFMFIGYDC